MSSYIGIIKQSFVYFPIVALLLTLPYLFVSYHKYGSVFSLRVLIIYSLVLYLMTVYFLVILPLPPIEVVEQMTGRYCQLIPFNFIYDIYKDVFVDGVKLYLSKSLYQVLFNVLMVIPFGMYLRYYFKCELKKVIILSLLLSLFFELTQLSGLYFIYPRPYRLFDVDDLMVNTLGGLLGYYCVKPFMLFLPDRDKIDSKSRELSAKVSVLRKCTALIADGLFFVIIITVAAIFFNRFNDSGSIDFLILLSAYFIVVPILTKGSTIGLWTVRLKYEGEKYQPVRYVVMLLCQAFILYGSVVLMSKFADFLLANIIDIQYKIIVRAIVALIYVFVIFVDGLLLLLGKQTIAQKIAGLKLVSTAKTE